MRVQPDGRLPPGPCPAREPCGQPSAPHMLPKCSSTGIMSSPRAISRCGIGSRGRTPVRSNRSGGGPGTAPATDGGVLGTRASRPQMGRQDRCEPMRARRPRWQNEPFPGRAVPTRSQLACQRLDPPRRDNPASRTPTHRGPWPRMSLTTSEAVGGREVDGRGDGDECRGQSDSPAKDDELRPDCGDVRAELAGGFEPFLGQREPPRHYGVEARRRRPATRPAPAAAVRALRRGDAPRTAKPRKGRSEGAATDSSRCAACRDRIILLLDRPATQASDPRALFVNY